VLVNPVDFPADVREDIKLFGIVETRHLMYLVPAIALIMVLFLVPGIPIGFKLVVMVFLPMFLVFYLSFGVGRSMAKRRAFSAQPTLLLAKQSDDREPALQSIVRVQSCDEPYVVMEDKTISVLVEAQPGSWSVNTDSGRQLLVDSWQSVLRRASLAGVLVAVYCDFLPHLPRREWAWRETAFSGLPTGLAQVLESRLDLHKQLSREGRAREWVYIVRFSVDPWEMAFSRRPKSAEERTNLAKKTLLSLVGEAQNVLQSAGVSCVVLGAEAARDVLSRQLNPVKYQEYGPVKSTGWVLSSAPPKSEAELRHKPQESPRPHAARKTEVLGGGVISRMNFLDLIQFFSLRRLGLKLYRHYFSERGIVFVLFHNFDNPRLRNISLQYLYDHFNQVELLTGSIESNLDHDNLLVFFPPGTDVVVYEAVVFGAFELARRNFVRFQAGVVESDSPWTVSWIEKQSF